MRRSLSVLAVSLAAFMLVLCAMAEDASVSFPAICTKPCDVVVCGGGPAGCAAAIAARRSGLDVLLVEAQSRLGGTATSGGVSHWLGGRNDAGEWVVGGIFRELSLRAEKEGAAILPKHPEGKTYQPYAWLPWFIHGVVLDSDRVATMLDCIMAEEGVDVLFETCAVGVEKSADRITHVITHSKDGFRRIPAKVVIDATGDADVANFAGCPVFVGRDGDHLTTPASLTFHLSHVDGKALWDDIERTREPKFRPLIEELKRKGEWPFPYDIFISVKGLAEDEVMINTMRLTEIDGTDAESRTKGYVRGRREAYLLLDILRKHFPGFRDAQMKSIAPMLGVRETRRIDGAFKLTVEDLRSGTEFPDTVGYSMYGWDLPDPKKPSVQPMVDETGGGFVNKAKKQLVTPIPYRVMVPRGCVNILCPGRAISVERDVLGPLRVMAPCMAMGEACGVAAKQIAGGAANRDVDVPALLAELRSRGCIVDKAALPVVRPRVDPATGKEISHVCGLIAESEKYESLHPRFAKAFAFMRRPDLAELPCGRYEIDGTNCWAMVQEVSLKPFAKENQYEVHRAFIDIQAPIAGCETIGVVEPDSNVFDNFDNEKDVVLFNAKGEPWTLKPGEFAVFFPERGAHAPGLSSDCSRKVRKLVIKVRASCCHNRSGQELRLDRFTRVRLAKGSYCCQLAGVSSFRVDDVTFDFDKWNHIRLNMDGIHLDGDCHHGRITDLFGTCFDDLVAVNANDGFCSPKEAPITVRPTHQNQVYFWKRRTERNVAKSKLLRQNPAVFCYNIIKTKVNRECHRKPDCRLSAERDCSVRRAS